MRASDTDATPPTAGYVDSDIEVTDNGTDREKFGEHVKESPNTWILMLSAYWKMPMI